MYSNVTDLSLRLKALRQRLMGRPNDDFKIVMLKAVQDLETLYPSAANALESVMVLEACLSCHEQGEDLAAHVLMRVAGSLVSPQLLQAIAATIRAAMLPIVK